MQSRAIFYLQLRGRGELAVKRSRFQADVASKSRLYCHQRPNSSPGSGISAVEGVGQGSGVAHSWCSTMGQSSRFVASRCLDSRARYAHLSKDALLDTANAPTRAVGHLFMPQAQVQHQTQALTKSYLQCYQIGIIIRHEDHCHIDTSSFLGQISGFGNPPQSLVRAGWQSAVENTS